MPRVPADFALAPPRGPSPMMYIEAPAAVVASAAAALSGAPALFAVAVSVAVVSVANLPSPEYVATMLGAIGLGIGSGFGLGYGAFMKAKARAIREFDEANKDSLTAALESRNDQITRNQAEIAVLRRDMESMRRDLEVERVRSEGARRQADNLGNELVDIARRVLEKKQFFDAESGEHVAATGPPQ